MDSPYPFSASGVLSALEIKERNLVIGAKENQYQINGCDLTVGKVFYPLDLPFGTKPTDMDYEKIPLILEDEDVEPYWVIEKGQPVLIEIAETINLDSEHGFAVGEFLPDGTIESTRFPTIGYAVGRSSMLRIGAVVHGAFWDWGYVGKGKLLVIPMAADLLLRKGDRFAQIAFWPANTNDKQYNGSHQNEGVKV